LVPIYFAILLLKAMKSLGKLVTPLARLLPGSFPGETVVSFLLVLILCVLVGMVFRTQFGQSMRAGMESSILQKSQGRIHARHTFGGENVDRTGEGHRDGRNEDDESSFMKFFNDERRHQSFLDFR
jgi:hypothetical protein